MDENILSSKFHKSLYVTIYNGPPQTIIVPYHYSVISGDEKSIIRAMEYCSTLCFNYISNPSDNVIVFYLKDNRWKLLKDIKINRPFSKQLIIQAISINGNNYDDFKDMFDEDETLKLMYDNIHIFKFIKNPSYKMCKLAVSTHGNLIEYIDNQTMELCEIAVANIVNSKDTYYDHSGFVKHLKFWNEHIIEMIINDKRITENFDIIPNITISQIQKAILMVPHRLHCFTSLTFEQDFYTKAFNIDYTCIRSIPPDYQTIEMRDYIKSKHKTFICHFKNKTLIDLESEYEILMQDDYDNICHIPEEYQTVEMCENAIRKHHYNLIYCYHITKSMLQYIFNSQPKIPKKNRFRFIEQYGEEIVLRIVKADCQMFRCLQKIQQTDKIIKEVLNQNGYMLQYVTSPTDEQILIALKNQPKAIKYIMDPIKITI